MYIMLFYLYWAFFASVFTAKASPKESQALEVREEAWLKDYLLLVEEYGVRDHLSILDTHKFMGPDGMHPGALSHCWATLHHLWKVLENRRGAQGLEESQCHSSLQKGQERRPRELQDCQPHLHPGKDDGAAHSGCHH